jgi:ribosomal protein L35
VTATGKLKRLKAGKKHLNGPKSGKRKMSLRRPVTSGARLQKKYVVLMGLA